MKTYPISTTGQIREGKRSFAPEFGGCFGGRHGFPFISFSSQQLDTRLLLQFVYYIYLQQTEKVSGVPNVRP
jgi:hypothetical protein